MFGFLKDKLKEAISKFSKKTEEEAKVEETVKGVEVQPVLEEKIEPKEKIKETKIEKEVEPEIKEEIKVEEKKPELVEGNKITLEEPQIKKEKKGFLGIFKKKEKVEEIKQEIIEENLEQVKPEIKEVEEKKGFFAKVTEKLTTKKISNEQFNELFEELEIILMENNVAIEVIDKIKEDLKLDLVEVPLKGKLEELIKESLRKSLEDILKETDFDLIKEIKNKKEKPYVIVFVGVNGSGKTTTIAKLANLFKENGLKPVLVAGDTFRAASIHQLEEHANNLNIKLIKQDYNSDPTAVAFDGKKYAEAHGYDVVLIDTAGRQHSNKNLIEEMKKIVRVIVPDLKVFIGEGITGNDCIEQIKEFNNAVEIDSIILSKVDVDEKGGTAISVSYVSGKPILYIGTGQKYENLEKFNKNKIINEIFK